MNIVWTTQAQTSYYETLDYWDEHNGSDVYSNKIIKAIDTLAQELMENPYFLAHRAYGSVNFSLFRKPKKVDTDE